MTPIRYFTVLKQTVTALHIVYNIELKKNNNVFLSVTSIP